MLDAETRQSVLRQLEAIKLQSRMVICSDDPIANHCEPLEIIHLLF